MILVQSVGAAVITVVLIISIVHCWKSGAHLPDEGFDKTVNGVRFFCEPKSDKGRHSPHRIKVECVVCNKWYPFGRMEQHLTRRDHRS